MNAKSTVSGATAATVPGALIVGVALISASFAGLNAQRNQYRAQAAKPGPTTTVTAPPAVRPAPVSTTTVTGPSPSPTEAAVVPVSDRTTAMPHTGSGGQSSGQDHAQARPSSSPQPAQSPSAAVAPRCAAAATAPTLHACLKLGGSR